MAEEVILTKEGKEELEKRLEYLKVTKRAEITERIKTAREFGDLSENAEYDAAKNEQALIEGEIAEIENQLKYAEIITVSAKKDVAGVGATVTFTDLTDGESYTFAIVGTTEADPFENRISNESPVGAAILGQKVNTVVQVNTPVGELAYKIVKVD